MPKKKTVNGSDSSDDEEFSMGDENDQEDDFVEDEIEEEYEEPPKSSKKRKDMDSDDNEDEEEEEEEKPKKKTKTTKDDKKKTTTKSKSTTTKKDTKDKKPAKKTTRDVKQIEEQLNAYCAKHNRPHAVQSLLTAHKNTFTKAFADKALASLCKKGELTLKQSGKAKVYYVNQDKLQTASKDELIAMDKESKAKTLSVKELTEEVKHIQKEHSSLMNSLTNDQLDAKIIQQKEEIEKKKIKLASLQTGDLISDEDLKKVDEDLEKFLKEWKKRRRLAKDIIAQISEGRDIKPRDFMDELDLEDDPVDIDTIGKLE
eukprot:gene5667-9488_t